MRGRDRPVCRFRGQGSGGRLLLVVISRLVWVVHLSHCMKEDVRSLRRLVVRSLLV